MNDLIRREDAMQLLKQDWDASASRGDDERADVCKFHYIEISNIHTAEPKAGEWIETSEGTVCSNCHEFPYDDGEYHIANWHSDFCPNCGAKMKGESNGI